MGATLKEAATEYARAGMAVFPLVERGKTPAIKGGFKKATTDVEQVEAWWNAFPDHNIGIATGTPSGGLVVIDLDVDNDNGEDGYASMREWERSHGGLPETLSAKTGSGGLHLYYRADVPFSCSVDNDRGIDIRADGGYVVAPPSVHPNGRIYDWEFLPDEIGIANADKQVLAFLRFAQGGKKKHSDKFVLPEAITSGGRNDTLMRYAASLQRQGFRDDEILTSLLCVNMLRCTPPLANTEVINIVKSVCGRYEKGSVNEEKAQVSLILNDKGMPKHTIENCLRVLAADPQLSGHFYFDTRAYTRMASLPLPWEDGEGDRALKDTDYINLTAHIEKNYFSSTKTNATDALLSVCEANPRNLVKEWLESLEWDGKPRIDKLLTMFLGVEPDDYSIAVMHLLMQGAVARGFSPGVKFDYMPVLVGAQGIGKSAFVRRLAMRDEWFSDNFNTVSGDAAAEKLRGLWVAEVAELLAIKRAQDVESIKAFITSTCDVFRPKYGRETVQRPRGCVFVGTTNDTSFLTDTSGNRRFLPIECGIHPPCESVFDDKMNAYFEQAWAEAVHIFKIKQPKLMLAKELEKEALRRQEHFLEDDPRIGMIEDFLQSKIALATDANPPRVCVIEILSELYPDVSLNNISRRTVNEIHAILRRYPEWQRLTSKQKFPRFGVQTCYQFSKYRIG